MEVILLERIEKLGTIGDTVTVKDGYARNYLIPSKKALRATEDNKASFAKQKTEIEKVNAEQRKDAEKRVKHVDDIVVTIIRQASEDGRLYGSVSARDIAAGVAETDKSVTHKEVRLNDAIKTTGIYSIQVYLHPEVSCWIRVNVARTDTEAEEAMKAGTEAKTPEEVHHDEDEQKAAEAKAKADAAAKEAKEQAAEEAADADAESDKGDAEASAA